MSTTHTPLPPGTKVRFAKPLDDHERSAVMTVIEDRTESVLVTDDSLAHWPIPPQSAYAREDLVLVEAQSPIELRPGRFYICEMPGEYAGYTTGYTTWNGWECPQFELEEAQRVVAAYNAMAGRIVWDEVSRVFSNSVTGEVWDAVGTGLYAIGAWAWCWESAVEYPSRLGGVV